MKKLTVLVCSFLAVSLSSQAEVYFDENFENHLVPAWSTESCVYMGFKAPFPVDGCNPKISTEVPHSGGKSLRGDYTGACDIAGVPGGDCGVWAKRVFASTVDKWNRYWYRTKSFQYNSTRTKTVYDYTNTKTSFSWGHSFTSRQFDVHAQDIPSQMCPNGNTGQTCIFGPNVRSIPLADDKWYCIETRIKLNTPGVADGIIEGYVDGVQTIYYDKKMFRAAGDNGGFDNVKLFVQAGKGIMYYDDFAVGNTRIGCGAAPLPPPPTPTPMPMAPAAPKDLRAR